MRYIDSIRALPLVLILFGVVTFLSPLVSIDVNTELIITVSTFLFAILAGFFISRLNNRYDKIRELTSSEDASLLSLYHVSKIYGDKFAGEMREIIDKYYITCYENPVSGAYKETAPLLLRFWSKLKELIKYRAESAYQILCQQLIDLEKARKESSAIYSEKLGLGQWVMLLSLAFIILTGLFIIRTGSLTSNIIIVILSAAIVLVLLIVRDLSNCMLGGTPLMEESGQEVLEAIGKERYYHNYFIKKGISRPDKNPKIKRYRLGIHPRGSARQEIKIIEK